MLLPFRSRALPGLRQAQSRLALRSGWICSSCRTSPSAVQRWSSSQSSAGSSSEKPYYITTPIFYVNAAPHIGHLYSMVLADVIKRWQQIKGKEAFLCTGTDEHGMKIQRAALKHGMEPKEFCDGNSNKFRELVAAANISNDFFIRTTDQEHKDAVAQFWLHLKHSTPESLGLYKGSHEGWYCVSDECFYPEDLVRPSIAPQTGKKIMVSTETDNEVEWIKEETWFFPLTKYKDALLKLYDENPGWIKPAHRMAEAREWIENHLEDLSVTRPASRLNWGVSDPEDKNQTIYVWVDALINYITKAGYGSKWHTAKDDMGIWPANLQVIGKDILRFHTIYWPALLMALGLPVSKGYLCHNHWTMSNRKMSKSLGNVVNPFFAIQRWGIDPLRYFLMRNATLHKDMSYSNQLIGTIYMKELQANIGNLFYRIAKPKSSVRWSTLEAVAAFRNGSLNAWAEKHGTNDSEADYFSLESHLSESPEAFCKEMDDYDTSAAIRVVFELLRETNRYVSDTKPWDLVKNQDADSRVLLNWVIFNSAEALRIAGILLQPIMPTKASELLDALGVRPDRRTVEFAAKGKDADYGTESKPAEPVPRMSKWDTLFPPTASADLSDDELLEHLRVALLDKTRNKMNQMAELLAMEARMGEEAVAKLLAETHAAKAIQEATASEPMTLEEEYENQQSWRTSHDKLTFIICEALSGEQRSDDARVVTAKVDDSSDNMKGDVNFFLYLDDDDEDGAEQREGSQIGLRGEIDVMIAGQQHRGKGTGEAAVRTMLAYIRKNLTGILQEYAQGENLDKDKIRLVGLMAKIKEDNTGSRGLFKKLGFRQEGEANYFGEVKMVMSWEEIEHVGMADGLEYRERTTYTSRAHPSPAGKSRTSKNSMPSYSHHQVSTSQPQLSTNPPIHLHILSPASARHTHRVASSPLTMHSIIRLARPLLAPRISPLSQRTFSCLSPLRPTLTSTFRPNNSFTPSPTATATASPAETTTADVVPKTALSMHPSLQGAMQLRFGPRNTMNGHTRLVQKRRHGWLKRTRSKTGRRILQRRKLKGRRHVAW
ncbi:tRNA synthetases class I (M) domain-containing protein [Trichoderma sp. TUCIM 5745]